MAAATKTFLIKGIFLNENASIFWGDPLIIYLNSTPPSAAYICKIGAKPLPEAMLTYYQLDP